MLLLIVMAKKFLPVGGIGLFHVLLDDLRLRLFFLVLGGVGRNFERLRENDTGGMRENDDRGEEKEQYQ